MTLPERMIQVETKLDDIKDDVKELKRIFIWGIGGAVVLSFVSTILKDAIKPDSNTQALANSLVAMLKNLY